MNLIQHPAFPRVVFMGTPEFATASFDRLVRAGIVPIAVVTAPDRKRGRGQQVSMTAVKIAARDAGVGTIFQPESVRDPSFAEAVRSVRPDIIVVVAFRILPPEVFSSARLGAFNLHGSLLPLYRGAAPIHRAVMNGETRTGVTTFFLEKNVDTGKIILQKSMSIDPDETVGSVHDRMMVLGAEAVLETVVQIADGTVQTTRQDDTLATAAPKIHSEDCHIPWGASARVVHNHIRGLSPHPGAWSEIDGQRLKIYRSARTTEESIDGLRTALPSDPGGMFCVGNRLFVRCGDGPLEILELQQPGRRRMPADKFVRGYQITNTSRLT